MDRQRQEAGTGTWAISSLCLGGAQPNIYYMPPPVTADCTIDILWTAQIVVWWSVLIDSVADC